MNDSDQPSIRPVILALDTSAGRTSIALARGDEIIATLLLPDDGRRSERLWLDIGELLQSAGLTIEAVELFGVCIGPGGFTGLRVGLAAVKGLAAATDKPAAGVTSLEAAAMAAADAAVAGAAVACAMVGAYKGEVYWQLFACDQPGLPVALSEPLVSTSTEALARLADFADLVFVGEAAETDAGLIRDRAGARWFEEGAAAAGGGWRVGRATGLVAEAVAHAAYLKWQQGAVESAEELRALYVRPAEAEVKRSLGLLGSKIERSRRAD